MPPMPHRTEAELRQEIVTIACIAADKGLITSSDGNLSIRLDEARVLVTPSGVYKWRMQPEDLVTVDMTGQKLAGPPHLRATSEVKLHLEVYRQRPDVDAVLHAHPPYAVALSIAGVPLPVNLIPEVLLALGDVPTAPYATPGTEDLALSVSAPIREHDAVILSHHGSVTVGATLEEALIAVERLEAAARAYHLAHALGAVHRLPPDEVERLREIGARLRGKA